MNHLLDANTLIEAKKSLLQDGYLSWVLAMVVAEKRSVGLIQHHPSHGRAKQRE